MVGHLFSMYKALGLTPSSNDIHRHTDTQHEHHVCKHFYIIGMKCSEILLFLFKIRVKLTASKMLKKFPSVAQERYSQQLCCSCSQHTKGKKKSRLENWHKTDNLLPQYLRAITGCPVSPGKGEREAKNITNK